MGVLAEGARPECHRLICPCLTSPSVVLWPGTLTPTITRQEALTTFISITFLLAQVYFFKGVIVDCLLGIWHNSYLHLFWFCFLILLHITSRELYSAQMRCVWQTI